MHEDLPNNPGVVHHYTAEILSVQEQYAFGMEMPGRSFSVEEYRYGFNGKENQDELMANNNSQDFGARMYDARVGRWWGMDYMANKYHDLTPYHFVANNPIMYVDKDGKDYTVTVNHNTKTILIQADYYVVDQETKVAALAGIQKWIETNGNFTYEVGHGKEKINYDIVFEMNCSIVDDLDGCNLDRSDGKTNTLKVSDDEKEYKSALPKKPWALMKNFNRIVMKRKSIKHARIIISHEMGHAFGINHFGKGLMHDGYNPNYDEGNFGIDKFNLRYILNNVGIGKIFSEGIEFFTNIMEPFMPDDAPGKGTRMPDIGVPPTDFNNGIVEKGKAGNPKKDSPSKCRSVRTLDPQIK
jgi:RHS repeat-associated protein